MTLLHCDEEEADSCGEQQVHGLVEQFGGEDAPDEEMVAQDGHQHDVGGSRHGPQQGQAVAAVTHSNRASGERGELCEEESSYAALRFLRVLNQPCCRMFGEGSDFR